MKLFEIVVEYHKTLNPKLWKDLAMKDDIRVHLIKIAKAFIESLEIDTSYIEDIIVTGSNCNFNWTKNSDIDLHVVVDYKKFQDGCSIADVEELFNNKKSVWNDSHDITVLDIPIELYIQDTAGNNSKDGTMFSLYHNKWLKMPFRYNQIKITQKEINDAFVIMKDKIEKAIKSDNMEKINAIKSMIADKRKESLQQDGEFALFNLVYKKLRKQKILDKLYKSSTDLENEELSL